MALNPAPALRDVSPTLARVVGGRLCAGCGLCAGISDGALRMIIAPSGYARPEAVRAMGIDPADVTSFRYRGMGWPGEARAETTDSTVGRMSYNDSWGAHLSKDVQFRCKICPDAADRQRATLNCPAE